MRHSLDPRRSIAAEKLPSLQLTRAGTYPQDLAIFSCDSVLVALGDTIGGHTVSSLDSPGVNDFGVIAFLASFTDGSQAIVEAAKRWRRWDIDFPLLVVIEGSAWLY